MSGCPTRGYPFGWHWCSPTRFHVTQTARFNAGYKRPIGSNPNVSWLKLRAGMVKDLNLRPFQSGIPTLSKTSGIKTMYVLALGN